MQPPEYLSVYGPLKAVTGFNGVLCVEVFTYDISPDDELDRVELDLSYHPKLFRGPPDNNPPLVTNIPSSALR
jgi:hypothetical protein